MESYALNSGLKFIYMVYVDMRDSQIRSQLKKRFRLDHISSLNLRDRCEPKRLQILIQL